MKNTITNLIENNLIENYNSIKPVSKKINSYQTSEKLDDLFNDQKENQKQTLENFDIYGDTKIQYNELDKQAIKNYFKMFEFENQKQKTN